MGFIEDIRNYAVEVYNKYGVLPSLTISQAILESGYGKSGLARNANNVFGIKGIGPAGGYEVPTEEYKNGKYETILGEFRAYNNWSESFNDYGELLATAPRYKDVVNAKDWKSGVSAMAGSGYATDPNYGAKLADIITSNELYKIDAEVTKNPSLMGSNWGINDYKTPSGSSGTTRSWGDETDADGKDGFFNLGADGWLETAGEWFKSVSFLLIGLLFLGLGIWLFFGAGGSVINIVKEGLTE
jgi:hypothetical protein